MYFFVCAHACTLCETSAYKDTSYGMYCPNGKFDNCHICHNQIHISHILRQLHSEHVN